MFNFDKIVKRLSHTSLKHKEMTQILWYHENVKNYMKFTISVGSPRTVVLTVHLKKDEMKKKQESIKRTFYFTGDH